MPPEAVKDHVDTMEELVGPVPSATGELDAEFQEDRNELKQEENGTYTDPDLLGYTDKLCSQEACVTKEMPPEAVKDHVDTMEELVGPVPSATGELDAEFQEDRNELKQEENGTYTDPDLLGYTDKLCSQEACVTKVVQKRFLDLNKEFGVWAPTSHSAPHLDSSTRESNVGRDARHMTKAPS
ncbi:NUT family member 2F [Camelus dromedarius]|uniref:NUT family member 2F n=1 Tax=Camelus dromedarius TaxID=9838 RepID=A0A5N4DJA2_CAMDR|nr:NUT family member 2F [Camelus dromedarius]